MICISIIKKYLEDIGEYNLLSFEEEQALGKEIKETGSIEARDKLVMHNLRLVVNIAKNYNYSNIEFMDLIQEGNDGLMYAAERFDYEKGFRFSTYATNWIRQRIKRFVDNYRRIIRFPVHIEERINRVNRARRELEYKLKRIPTVKEISKETNISVRKIKQVDMLPFSSNLLSDEVDENGNTFEMFFSDTESLNPAESHLEDEKQRVVNELLSKLNDNESFIIKHRFGFMGENFTLQEVGDLMDLSRERVRQLEQRALKKLRTFENIELLTSFL